jgi:general stress protein 26
LDHDDAVQLFTTRTSRKARRLATTPRASLVAANEMGEPENWVAITGPATIETDGAQALAVRLAERYWDLGNPDLAAVAENWRTDDSLIRVVIQAEQVTRYS